MSTDRLEQTLAQLATRHLGPGGAVAVLRDGAVLARHAWGWADAERRLPFTPQTMALVCSITKQFTCGLLLDQFPDPTVLDGDIRARMPLLTGVAPGALHLAHNQSGLRDYWATAMLSGAAVEGDFGEADAQRLVARTRSLQFAPGTRYSYCNQNFRLLGDVVAARAGRPFAELLRARVLEPAGMPYARLAPDTSTVPGGSIGYEGSVEAGFRPAVNHIFWTGDAGLSASLDDMIAWERHIDATRDDPAAVYWRQAAPVRFADGASASYGFGLARMKLFGRDATGHGGGLRGWRSFRFYIRAERLSVVVLFNHMADPRAAGMELLAAALGETPLPAAAPGPTTELVGRYIEPETGLATRVEAAPEGKLRLQFSGGPELLAAVADGSFAAPSARLSAEGGGVRLQRPVDNLASTLVPVSGTPVPDIAGTYRSDEYDAEITIVASGGLLYGACSGDLGRGAMQPLLPHADDIWLLPCPRALDFSPPGDWTLTVVRDTAGTITGLVVGCWLARGIGYRRVG